MNGIKNTICVYRCARPLISLILVLCLGQVLRADIYASPTGASTNSGTIASPLDLATALYRSIAPGSTVWLLGGTYAGNYTNWLSGTATQPITVRSYPGQHARIADNRSWANGATLQIYGTNVVFQDLEITNTGTDRIGPPPAATPFRPIGVNVEGANVTLIDLVIHDTGHGIGLWSNGLNAQVYGNIIYNCGSMNQPGVSNENGHGMYIQNDTGRKMIQDNIIFDQYGWGIAVYPNPGGLKNITFDGNVIFNNGLNTAPNNIYNSILISGYAPYYADGIVVSNNYTWATLSQNYGSVESDANMCFGCYTQMNNGSLSVTGNYFAGGIPTGIVKGWNQLTMTGNTFAGFMGYFLVNQPASPGTYQWDNNAYFGGNNASDSSLFVFNNYLTNYNGWLSRSGFDGHSSWTPGNPGMAVFVRPDVHEPGRGHVIVYNWPVQSAVSVDLSGILKVGSNFQIVNVQNYYGTPVVAGKYAGGTVSIPLTAVTPTPAVGSASVAPSGPTFNAFVVMQQ